MTSTIDGVSSSNSISTNSLQIKSLPNAEILGTNSTGLVISSGGSASTQTIYVATGGNDATGTGTFSNPYATVVKAMSTITSPSMSNYYVIKRLGAVTETAALNFKPCVNVVGDGSPWTLTTIGLDSLWNAADTPKYAQISNHFIANLSKSTVSCTDTSSDAYIYFTNIVFSDLISESTLTFNLGSPVLYLQNVIASESPIIWIFYSGQFWCYDSTFSSAIIGGPSGSSDYCVATFSGCLFYNQVSNSGVAGSESEVYYQGCNFEYTGCPFINTGYSSIYFDTSTIAYDGGVDYTLGYPIGNSVTVTNGGSGYVAATTTLTASAPDLFGGYAPTFTFVVTGGVISSVGITSLGCGYTNAPTITVTDTSGGSGAILTATLNTGQITPAYPMYTTFGLSTADLSPVNYTPTTTPGFSTTLHDNLAGIDTQLGNLRQAVAHLTEMLQKR